MKMVLLNKYHQLIERNTDEIHIAWKALTITIFVAAAVTGLISSFCFSYTRSTFGENCILSSTIIFNNDSENMDNSLSENNNTSVNFMPIDLTNSMWGTDWMCSFCIFTPLMSTIIGIIWAAFFMMCPKGGRGYPSSVVQQPFRLIYPAILCAICYIIAIWISTVKMSDGVIKFCEFFEPIYKSKLCVEQIDEYTLQFGSKKYPFYSNLMMSITFSYFTLILWICLAAINLLRVLLIVDFKIQQVHIYTAGKDENSAQDEKEEIPHSVDLESKDLSYNSAQSDLSTLMTIDQNIKKNFKNVDLPSKPASYQKSQESSAQSSNTSYYSLSGSQNATLRQNVPKENPEATDLTQNNLLT